MHQFTSVRAGYRKSLEGWAKAGIHNVEPCAAGFVDEKVEEIQVTLKIRFNVERYIGFCDRAGA